MNINTFFTNNKILNSFSKKEAQLKVANFVKLRWEINDSFSFSGKSSSNGSGGNKNFNSIPAELEKAILEDYKTSKYNYGAITKFSKAHNIDRKTYSYVVAKNGLERVSNSLRSKISSGDKGKIKKMLDKGMTRSEIEQKLGVSTKSLRRYLQREGLDKYVSEEWRNLIEKIKIERGNNRTQDEICKKLGIDEKTYKKAIGIGVAHKLLEPVLTPEQEEKIKNLVAQNKTYAEIATEMKLNHGFVQKFVRSLKNSSKIEKPHTHAPLSDDMKLKIVEHYKAYCTRYGAIEKFCRENNISHDQYYKVIEKSGFKHVDNSHRSKTSEEDLETIRQMLKENKSRSEIMQAIGISEKPLRRILYSMGVQRRQPLSSVNVEALNKPAPKVVENPVKIGTKSKYNYEDLRAKIIALKKEDSSISFAQLSERLNVPENIINRTLTMYPDIPRKNLVVTNELVKKVGQMRKQHRSIKEIMEKTGLKRNQVLYIYTKLPKEDRSKSNKVEEVNANKPKGSEPNSVNTDKSPEKPHTESVITNTNAEQEKNMELLRYFQSKQHLAAKVLSSEMEYETKIRSLKKIGIDIKKRLANHDEALDECQMLQKLLNAIKMRINELNDKIAQAASKSQTASVPVKREDITKLTNVTWLDEKDFENKLRAVDRIFNINVYDFPGNKSAALEAQNRLKAAYPEDCVIWVESYDSQNTNTPNVQKYTVKCRFYESENGIKNGPFGTKKISKIEFFAKQKEVYESFINSLIENKNKIINS